jgi:hypothetical protein
VPLVPLVPREEHLRAGRRVLAQLPGSRLWVAAEVAEVGRLGHATVVTLEAGRKHVLPLACLALSAHAPDPHGGEGRGSDSEPDGSQACAALPASAAGEQEGEEEERSSEMSGSEEEASEAEGEEEEAWAGAAFGRLGCVMEEAASLLQQQAAAGPQAQTALFFGSEAHSRGIGSKARGGGWPHALLATWCNRPRGGGVGVGLAPSSSHRLPVWLQLLARMGYKGYGFGLGKRQQGMQQALAGAPLRRGAGLGLDAGGGTREVKGKRKRSGKQRRRDKALAAAAEAREERHAAQHQLEQQTGSEGLFAVLNSIIGDGGAAQAVKAANLGMPAASSAGAAGLAGAQGKRGVPAPREEDRRQLARRADELAQLRQKVQRLR